MSYLMLQVKFQQNFYTSVLQLVFSLRDAYVCQQLFVDQSKQKHKNRSEITIEIEISETHRVFHQICICFQLPAAFSVIGTNFNWSLTQCQTGEYTFLFTFVNLSANFLPTRFSQRK